MIADEHVFVVPLVRIVAKVDPLLLNELELAGEAGGEGHGEDAALLRVRGDLGLGDGAAVWKSASGDAAAIDQLAIEAEGIAGINATDVRADGTVHSFGVCAVGEVGVAV